VKKPGQIVSGPISFTAEEIEQARAGNFAPAEKRLKRELAGSVPRSRKKRGKAGRKR